MNRLTQKIIHHILEFVEKREGDKFLVFLIRVIFGEQIESQISFEKIQSEFRPEIYKFKDFVRGHLAAAEKLTKKKNNENKNPNEKHMKPINNRLGNVLFPPERAIKFKSILSPSHASSDHSQMNATIEPTNKELKLKFRKVKNSIKLDTIDKSKPQVFELGGPNQDISGNGIPSNQLIIPTARRPKLTFPIKRRSSIFENLSEEHRETVDYLEYQIKYYRQRIHDYFLNLKNYANCKKVSSLSDPRVVGSIGRRMPRVMDLNESGATRISRLGKRGWALSPSMSSRNEGVSGDFGFLSLKKKM